MFELRQTPVFETWFLGLRKKHRAREAIAKRLVRLEAGNFGDTKALGGGVNELRIQHGPGYRLYYTVRRQSIILLLCGGTKGSQARDIRRAKALEKEMDDEDNTV
ncbi:MAG: type II toxin-antitoxin system RelE/ParE family toxin [Rhodobacter sp.]|nr:type II toxin-antitoxin system RelE/ParE family toxin [Rhodobacter sp.]